MHTQEIWGVLSGDFCCLEISESAPGVVPQNLKRPLNYYTDLLLI